MLLQMLFGKNQLKISLTNTPRHTMISSNMTEAEKINAYQLGWDAYWKGKSQTANPYGDILADEWVVGWLAAQTVNFNEL